jgi:hypothetical protein
VAFEHRDQPAVGGPHDVRQRRGSARDQVCLGVIVNVESLDLGREVGEQGRDRLAVIKRGTGDHRAGIADQIFKGEARRDDAGFGTGIGAGDQRVEDRPDTVEPRDISLGVIGILDPVLVEGRPVCGPNICVKT